MLIEFILYGLILIALLIGSYTDLKTREVPDYLSYSLIFSGLGLRLLYSAITLDTSLFVEGFVGFILFVIFGYIMYYSGQWGGGDSKLLMGIGALIGLDFNFFLKSPLVLFFINVLFAGAVYGMIWIGALAVKHRTLAIQEFKKLISKHKNGRNVIATISIGAIIASILWNPKATLFFIPATIILLVASILPLAFWYLANFVKAIENVAFYKTVNPDQLTEGDWIANDIYINDQWVTGPSDLGITNAKIKKLKGYFAQGKIEKITVKEGIPFVPSFLIGFIGTLMIGKWFGLF